MTDTLPPASPDAPALGIGQIFSGAFSLLHRHLMLFMALCVPLAMITPILSAIMFRSGLYQDIDIGETGLTAFFGTGSTLLILLEIVIWALVAAATTHASYRLRSDAPVSAGQAYGTTLRHAVPIVLVMLVTGIATGLAFMALIVPGLYLSALWFVIVPAIVVERQGFGAIQRSGQLTEGYRWAIVGLFVIYVLIMMLIGAGVGFVISFIETGLYSAIGTIGLYVGAAIEGVLGGYFYAIGAILAAEVYARLREIKEGATTNELAEVFA